MAAMMVVEMESGTARGHLHPHNGYYAGEFTSPCSEQPSWVALVPSFDDTLPA